MKEKILFIATEFPFPPKNGVTIPVYNYIKCLNDFMDVKLLVLYEGEQERAIKNEFNIEVEYLKVTKKNTIVTEIFGLGGTFEYYSDDYSLGKIEQFIDGGFDYILCSPISAVGIGKVIKELNAKSKLISAISDCYTAVLWNTNEFNSISAIIRSFMSKVRSLFMAKVEKKILSESDVIFVQSQSDKNWLIDKCALSNTNLIQIVTNCVSDSLFNYPTEFCNKNNDRNEFLFVATFTSDYYKNKLIWFYEKVWKKVDKGNSLLIIRGKGLRDQKGVISEILKDGTVQYIDSFEPDISSVYSSSQFLIAPIFKSYGFINKVGEALASGLVVIGDKTAFNAINGVQDHHNCLVANSSDDFINAINMCLNNKELCYEISHNAQLLAVKELQWNRDRIYHALKSEQNHR